MSAAATCYVTAAPDRLHWRYEPLGLDVMCAHAVLETIRSEAVDAFSRIAHGGLENGGILLGTRTDRSIEILAAIPLNCEHRLGPSFVLSPTDELSLQETLTSPKMATLQPVGLYISHSRRDFAMAEPDLRLLNRYFPEPWQMALLLIPSKTGSTRAGFFIRGPLGEPAFACAHQFVLSPPERCQEAPAQESAVSAQSTVSLPSEVSAPPAVSLPLAASSPPITALKAPRGSPRNLAGMVALLLLVMFGGGLLFGPRHVLLSSVPLHVTDLGSQLRIEWDPAHQAVRSARAATLEIHDGGSKPVEIPITRSGLDRASILYVPQSESVEVHLKLTLVRGAPLDSVVYFINPASRAAAPPAVVPAQPPPAASPAETAQPAPHQAEQKKTPKVFQLPQGQPADATPQRASINLPDAPDLPPMAAAPQTLLSALLATSVRPAGPPPLRTGRLIWTGSLHKNTVLSITPSGASSGVLSGRLPGVPVTVSVQPAELTDGGIAIYSKDPDRVGTSQPRNAWNGWDVAVFPWDPKQIAEVDIIERPGPANNWKRLLVRSGNRNVSVFVVDWQR